MDYESLCLDLRELEDDPTGISRSDMADISGEACDAIEQLQADNARLRKDYEEGLEAWKKNNEFFGGWCERLAGAIDKHGDGYELLKALAEYKTAMGARG